MQPYWFRSWLKQHLIGTEATLKQKLSRTEVLDSFLESAPEPIIQVRREPPTHTELSGGKGVDLTGELGCKHIDCLRKEVKELFHHSCHYFDCITLPDQALSAALEFNRLKEKDALVSSLVPALHAVNLIDEVGAGGLVTFEARMASCRDHAKDHAEQAEVAQAFNNASILVTDLAKSAKISWKATKDSGHVDLKFRLDHPLFEHSEWGTLCSKMQRLPRSDDAIRTAVANDVAQKYLAALSADALAARHSKTSLGTTIPFYKKLLATRPTVEVESIAFEISLPVSHKLPIESLIKFRREERPAFERFQTALRKAISERIKTCAASGAAALAVEIERDIIDPELRRINDLLSATKIQAQKGAASGLILGGVATTIGLLTPLSAGPVGTGLVVGGALSISSAVKKAVDDHLAAKKEVSLSDMYFLWKAHQHKGASYP